MDGKIEVFIWIWRVEYNMFGVVVWGISCGLNVVLLGVGWYVGGWVGVLNVEKDDRYFGVIGKVDLFIY